MMAQPVDITDAPALRARFEQLERRYAAEAAAAAKERAEAIEGWARSMLSPWDEEGSEEGVAAEGAAPPTDDDEVRERAAIMSVRDELLRSYVPFADFKAALLECLAGARALLEGASEVWVVHCVSPPRRSGRECVAKSQCWLGSAYAHAAVPAAAVRRDVFLSVSPSRTFDSAAADSVRVLRCGGALGAELPPPSGARVLVLDDAACTGAQLAELVRVLVLRGVRPASLVVAVPYATAAAQQLVRGTGARLVTARPMVHHRNASGAYGGGVLTTFQHKVPDPLSMPSELFNPEDGGVFLVPDMGTEGELYKGVPMLLPSAPDGRGKNKKRPRA